MLSHDDKPKTVPSKSCNVHDSKIWVLNLLTWNWMGYARTHPAVIAQVGRNWTGAGAFIREATVEEWKAEFLGHAGMARTVHDYVLHLIKHEKVCSRNFYYFLLLTYFEGCRNAVDGGIIRDDGIWLWDYRSRDRLEAPRLRVSRSLSKVEPRNKLDRAGPRHRNCCQWGLLRFLLDSSLLPPQMLA